MAAPILRTKLHVPLPRPDSISRPELLARLDDARESGYRLALLSAPAGYGKTTLVASWLARLREQQGVATTWLSLDADENDPVRFWSYFIAALRRIIPEAGEDSLGLLHASPSAPIQSVLALLLNDLAETDTPVAAVFDDFHHILAPEIHAGLAYLLEHLPSGVIIVILTRADPYLPLARLHARRQVLELRLGDLRFSNDEERDFFRHTMQLDLSDGQIEQLEQITEGWAAGLQMAGLSLKNAADLREAIRAYGSRDRLLLDFFTEEILAALPSAEQDFLARTAMLEPFCAELCNAVLEIENSGEMIAALERQNLFITPLDSTRTWYRYHPLFADLLRQRMGMLLSEKELGGLHRRAADWYASRKFNDQAIRHFLDAGEREAASRLVEEAAIPHLLVAEIVTVQNWLAAFGETWLEQDPLTSTIQAWTLMAGLRLFEIEPAVQRAERLVERATHLPEEHCRHLKGQIAAIRATTASNLRDIDEAMRQAHLALELLPEWNHALRSLVLLDLGDLYQIRGDFTQARRNFEEAAATARAAKVPLFSVNSLANLGNQQLRMGRLRQAERYYHEALQSAIDGGAPRLPVTGTAEIGLARVYIGRNQLTEARAHANAGMELVYLWNHPMQIILAHFCRVELELAAGDLESAETYLRKAKDLIKKHNLPFLTASAGILEANLLLRGSKAASHLAEVESTLRAAGDWIDPDSSQVDMAQMAFLRPGALLACARLWARRGQENRALALLEVGIRGAQAHELIGDEARLRLLRGALLAKCRMEEAFQDVEAALALTEEENARGVFRLEGSAAIDLLRSWLKNRPGQTGLSDFARSLVNELSPEDERRPELAHAPAETIRPHGVDALSEREVEVLRLVAAGLSNDAIAAELIVSTNTIKTHLKRIYEKLYVSSRLEAVNQARELKIL